MRRKWRPLILPDPIPTADAASRTGDLSTLSRPQPGDTAAPRKFDVKESFDQGSLHDRPFPNIYPEGLDCRRIVPMISTPEKRQQRASAVALPGRDSSGYPGSGLQNAHFGAPDASSITLFFQDDVVAWRLKSNSWAKMASSPSPVTCPLLQPTLATRRRAGPTTTSTPRGIGSPYQRTPPMTIHRAFFSLGTLWTTLASPIDMPR
ncbi:hypothetical protein BGZ63DRAFT_409179 [Mariannaea sp. PMI_226]|nr:hypothetical protein BGZ63DRAFT_409179 [Mariannaea sp. PMI_226]